MSDLEVRVVNRLGEDVAKNGREIGEIIVKGHSVPKDKIKNRNLTDGWLQTGDQGTIDKDGTINIIKPNKDLTNNDGGKISTIEIENVLLKHQAIQEIVIMAIPHIKYGEMLHAYVVLHEDYNLTEQEIIAYTKKIFSPANCPKKVTFMDELPKTTSGKILRTQLSSLI